jgi:hypothetical protein
VTSDCILSATLSRLTMSAARSSSAASGLQKVHVLRGGVAHQFEGGIGLPPSTQRPEPVCVMRPVLASNKSICSGSPVLHVFVDTREPTEVEVAARHVAGVCPDFICEPVTIHTSFAPEPWPHGHVYTSAEGFVLKSLISMHRGGFSPAVAVRKNLLDDTL